ncbi:MAG: hypothetical protein ACREL3_07300, partial [Gemmatimonadales bacterium]
STPPTTARTKIDHCHRVGPLIAVNALASAIWVGGLVAIFVAARAASRTLDPAQRVAFFRSLGRTYGVVGTTALLVAIVSGRSSSAAIRGTAC